MAEKCLFDMRMDDELVQLLMLDFIEKNGSVEYKEVEKYIIKMNLERALKCVCKECSQVSLEERKRIVELACLLV